MQKNTQDEQIIQESDSTLKTDLKTEEEKPAQPENPEKNKPKSKKTLWLVIAICCLLIIIVGFLFMQNSKNSTDNQPINTKEAESQSAPPSAVTQKPPTKEEILFQAFRYPNGNELPAGDDIYCVQLIMNTNDPAETVYQYYSDLIELNNWETGPVGMQTYDKIGFLHIYQDDFRASINLREETDEEKLTIIEVDITCLNEDAVTSTFNLPARPEETEKEESTQLTEPLPKPVTQNESITQNEGEYILPFSNIRAVVTADLEDLTPWELKVARNEIYARHGRPFVHQDLTCYFAQQPWYQIDQNYQEDNLSELEVSNAVFILNYEKANNSPLINKDSGCN
jgi:flagellar basal body-associated protein FliL